MIEAMVNDNAHILNTKFSNESTNRKKQKFGVRYVLLSIIRVWLLEQQMKSEKNGGTWYKRPRRLLPAIGKTRGRQHKFCLERPK